MDVWFDNVQVSHFSGQVLEENHYYPFGLTISEIGNNTSLPNQPYKYQGVVLNKEFGIETFETFYRGLDPQLGRFNSIDPYADDFLDLTPYNSMGNNPVSNIDPDGDYLFGLFGSTSHQRKAAKQYANETGGTVMNKHSKNIHVNYTVPGVPYVDEDGEQPATVYGKQQYFNEDGTKQNPSGVIKPYDPNWAQQWRENESFIGQLSYTTVDGIYVTFQNMFVKNFRDHDYAFHIGGNVSSVDDNVDAFVNTSSLFIPAGELKYGLAYTNKLNAAQFSKLFKGTRIARSAPKVRGGLNRVANKLINLWNKQVPSGSAAKTVIKAGTKMLAPKKDDK